MSYWHISSDTKPGLQVLSSEIESGDVVIGADYHLLLPDRTGFG